MALPELNKWLNGILKKKIPSSEKLYLCVKRHFDDMKRQDFGYVYNEKKAEDYINFLQQLTFVEGSVEGQKFMLAPFQKFIVGSIFGWEEKETGKRRFTDAYLQVAKKNAKTTLGGAMALTSFYKDPERRAQYVFAATSRDQANIAFNTTVALAEEFASEYGDVADATAFYSNSLQRVDSGSYMRSISKVAKNVEGRGAYFAFGDEYHLHSSDEVINNVTSGQAIVYHNNNLLIRATTAGNSIMGACHRFYINVVSKVLQGIIEDDNLFIFVTELDKDDWNELERLYNLKWPDDKKGNPIDLPIWQKANPNCPIAPTLQFLRKQFHQAMIQGGKKKIDVMTKHGNMWCSTASNWIADDIYMKGAYPEFKIEDTYGMDAYIGVDLARTTDLAAVMVDVVERKADSKDIHYVIPFIFIPESKMKTDPESRIEGDQDHVDYAKWAMEEFVIVAGETDIDDEIIEEKILWIIETWNVIGMNYDPALMNRLIKSIKSKVSTPLNSISQSFTKLSPPTRLLERLILSERLKHNGHPVLRWTFSNVMLQVKGDYIKISKEKCIAKVDPVVALVFALASHIFDEEEEELENPSIIIL